MSNAQTKEAIVYSDDPLPEDLHVKQVSTTQMEEASISSEDHQPEDSSFEHLSTAQMKEVTSINPVPEEYRNMEDGYFLSSSETQQQASSPFWIAPPALLGQEGNPNLS